MDDYVAKPIRVEELVAALERSPRRGEVEERASPAAAAAAVARRASGQADEGGAGDPAAIHREAIDQLSATMGAPFVAELIATFAEDGRALVAALRQGFGGGDLDGFRRAAHSLKSNAETLGAIRLAGLARELEGLARGGTLAGAGERLDPITREYERAAGALEEIRRGLAAQ
jgi:HPt (histidine-containing phosphotransfer) domain-containing protein